MKLKLTLRRLRKWFPLPSEAWKVIFQLWRMLSHSDFLLKSQDVLHGKIGMGLKDFNSQSTASWRYQLRQLGLFQNSIELLGFLEKKWQSFLRMAITWIWSGWDTGSKIFLAMWIESVTTMILEIFSLVEAWLMPHLIANNSASALVTKAAWCSILMSGWFEVCIYNIDVAISFLMLTSVVIITMDCKSDDSMVIESSW